MSPHFILKLHGRSRNIIHSLVTFWSFVWSSFISLPAHSFVHLVVPIFCQLLYTFWLGNSHSYVVTAATLLSLEERSATRHCRC